MPELATAPVTAEPATLVSTPPVQPAPVPAIPAGTPPAGPSDWRAVLPADLQAHKGLEKFKDATALARSYVELENYRGRSVVIPGPDAKPEDRAVFDAKVDAFRGVPDAPDKYVIAGPEGVPLDAGAVSEWQQIFHRGKFTPDQVALLTSSFFGSPMGNPAEAMKNLQTETTRALQAEWGGGFENNTSVVTEAVRRVDQMAGTKMYAALQRTGAAYDPDVQKGFLWIGKQFREAGDMPRDAHSGGPMGPDGAVQRIAEIMTDRTHPYWKGDKSAVAEMQRLRELEVS